MTRAHARRMIIIAFKFSTRNKSSSNGFYTTKVGNIYWFYYIIGRKSLTNARQVVDSASRSKVQNCLISKNIFSKEILFNLLLLALLACIYCIFNENYFDGRNYLIFLNILDFVILNAQLRASFGNL